MNTTKTKDTRPAAEISGEAVSQGKAQTVIDNALTVELSIQGSKDLFALLDNPPQPNNKLKPLAERYNKGESYETTENNGADQPAR